MRRAAAFSAYVTSRPWRSLALVLVVPIGLSAVGMSFFGLNDLEGWAVRDSYSAMADDAWDLAETQTFAYAKPAGGQTALTDAPTKDAPRSKNPRLLRIYIEDRTQSKNMMRRGALEFALRFG